MTFLALMAMLVAVWCFLGFAYKPPNNGIRYDARTIRRNAEGRAHQRREHEDSCGGCG